MISTRTSTKAATLGDHLIHDTIPSRPGYDNELWTACHYPLRSADLLNPEGQPLPITCAYCINELRSMDRLKEASAADLTEEQYQAVSARHKEERKQRAKPLGPIRARWTFVKALREAGLQ